MTEKNIGDQLKALRKKRGLSMEGVARLAGCCLNTYVRAERSGAIKRATFEKITSALGQPMTLEVVSVRRQDA